MWMQHDRVIAYVSKQLKMHKINYSTHNLELVIVMFILKIWRYYLYGVTYQIFTNHKSFKYLFTQQELSLRQRQQMKLLKDYDYTIEYHLDRANVMVDTLSRKTIYYPLLFALREIRVILDIDYFGALLAGFHVQLVLIDQVRKTQCYDS